MQCLLFEIWESLKTGRTMLPMSCGNLRANRLRIVLLRDLFSLSFVIVCAAYLALSSSFGKGSMLVWKKFLNTEQFVSLSC